jgi:hypothetical protein
MTASDPEATLCSHRVLSLAGGRLTPISEASERDVGNVIDFPRSRRPDVHGARRG